jgi:prevent-host-death family protein
MSHDSTWQLQEAKSRFSEVVELAEHQPQVVTKHGRPTVAIINFEEYQKWQASRTTLFEALMPPNGGILTDEEADTIFKRDRDNRLREIDFG